MEEKQIIESKSCYKKFFIFIIIIGFIFIITQIMQGDDQIIPVEYIGLFLIILGTIMIIYTKIIKLYVTNKRVYGIGLFKKRIDLPISNISAVSISLCKGISIGTSAGHIRFFGIANNKDIHKEIIKLLDNR